MTHHIHQMRQDANEVVTPWRRQPVAQIQANALAFARCFYPHETNNNFRKVTTAVLFVVWMALTLKLVPSPSSEVYLGITILCFTILGQQWELEKLRILGVEIGSDQRSSTDGSNDGGGD